jgi:uncharacterized DUF497 family protein
VKRVADEEMGAWLARFTAGPEDFEWDDGNRPKLSKHGVAPDEAEEIFRLTYVLAGRIVEPAHVEPRWLALGRTAAGRLLAIIFTRRGERVRPISCRAMRKDERKVYEQGISAEEA